MKVYFILLITILAGHLTLAQDFTIDFEQIPNEVAREQLKINTQYLNDFGITFVLADGTDPVLAEVGWPAAAFGGQYGDDTPAPGQHVGSFFLTDDGDLFGLNSPPLFIRSEKPLRKITAQILDIDFDERYLIELLDIDGAVLKTIRILDGDANTGDGLATPWEIEVDNCSAFYSVRIEGSRNQTGAFGLGVDNISFELAEIFVLEDVFVDVLDSECDQNSGMIFILNESEEELTYSLDGINFQSENIFENLMAGNYSLIVQNKLECLETIPFRIEGNEPMILSALVIATPCSQEGGEIVISVTGGTGNLSYSINNDPSQSEPNFNSLPAGIYTVEVIDEAGCMAQDIVSVDFSPAPRILDIDVTLPDCDEANGSLDIIAEGGSGQLNISVNQTLISHDYTISNIRSGTYQILVTDEAGCQEDSTIYVSQGRCPFYIPNAFSPNDDGVNDLFSVYPHPQFAGTFNTLRIFDRWGSLMYQDQDFDPSKLGWDGRRNNKTVHVGVYVYVLEVVHADGGYELIKGDVTVVK